MKKLTRLYDVIFLLREYAHNLTNMCITIRFKKMFDYNKNAQYWNNFKPTYTVVLFLTYTDLHGASEYSVSIYTENSSSANPWSL